MHRLAVETAHPRADRFRSGRPKHVEAFETVKSALARNAGIVTARRVTHDRFTVFVRAHTEATYELGDIVLVQRPAVVELKVSALVAVFAQLRPIERDGSPALSKTDLHERSSIGRGTDLKLHPQLVVVATPL